MKIISVESIPLAASFTSTFRSGMTSRPHRGAAEAAG
jgi:hypothetical protein